MSTIIAIVIGAAWCALGWAGCYATWWVMERDLMHSISGYKSRPFTRGNAVTSAVIGLIGPITWLMALIGLLISFSAVIHGKSKGWLDEPLRPLDRNRK